MTECANCGSTLVDRVHTEWWEDGVQAVFLCEECPAEFEVSYRAYRKELTDMGKEMVNND